MTDPHPIEKPSEKETEDPGATGPTGTTGPESDDGTSSPPALEYDFKIVPADPKSTLDFEDVADK